MKWLAQSTISARMIGLALLAAALTLGVGLFGLSQTSKVNDMLNTMYDTNLVPTADVANANMQAIYHNRAMFAYLAEDEKPKRAAIAEGMTKNIAQMNALIDKYRKTSLTAKETELLAQFDAAWPPYLSAAAQTTKLIDEGQSAEALAALLDQVAPIFQKADDLLSALVDVNVALGKKAYDDSDVIVAESTQATWAVIVAAVLLSVGVSLLISRSITRPLGGEPAEVASAANAVAEGDLTWPIRAKAGDDSSVVARMAAMQANLVKVVSNVRQNAESVATASAQIAQGNQDLSARTEEQASALEETAASMEQLSTTVKHNADNAQQANQLAQTASTVAVQGGEVVSRVVDTMKEINQSSTRIADIIAVIDGIAFQTNILALNAAVEAARAGEQGRGFAVVAGEVRTLAQRSAEAAKEIKTLISASVERVAAGTQLVDQAGTTMSEVVQSIGRVNQIMSDISRASAEQSAGVAQVGEAVSQMDQATQQNAALVEESAAAADSLRQQAQQLVQAVAVFKLQQGGGSLAAAPAAKAFTASAPHTATPAARPAAASRPAAKQASPAPAPAPQPATAAAGADDWASF
ncbi:methyl-accepting chemotaxis protein [Aquincola sp. MAHUQ-54]|uniref:Methyl-accepting chemotaxis protein n=1 Tax=Aquincola agrisoli TaxID=3119538 RepID=A0AAW9QCW7_9BURK